MFLSEARRPETAFLAKPLQPGRHKAAIDCSRPDSGHRVIAAKKLVSSISGKSHGHMAAGKGGKMICGNQRGIAKRFAHLASDAPIEARIAFFRKVFNLVANPEIIRNLPGLVRLVEAFRESRW